MLELKKISKTFNPGTVNEKFALHELSLSVPDGDFITIIGANGAGKSTLFGAISGSFLTDSGEILLDGQDVTLLPEYRRSKIIGRLFQDPMRGSAPGMTIEENLALAAGRSGWLGHISRRDRECFRAQLRELNMGLEDRLRQPVGLLSGGQRQALTLLMATIARPKLLLLDEHTAALDPAAAEKILAMTTHIAAEQKLTCLMVTHNMRAALALGNRTLMMNGGQIILDVSGEERTHGCGRPAQTLQIWHWQSAGQRPHPAFLNPAAAEVLPYTIFSIIPLCERFSGRNACSMPSISDAGQSREAGSLGTLRGGCTKKCVGIEGISAGAEVDEATLRLQRKAACKPENLQAAF